MDGVVRDMKAIFQSSVCDVWASRLKGILTSTVLE